MKLNDVRRRLKEDYMLYIMLIPAIIYFAVFHIWPLIGMKLAFYDYMIVGDDTFVGLKYFKQLFDTPLFVNVIKNTVIISTMKLILLFPFPVIFALLLNELRNGPFRKGVQIVSYLPHFLSWVVIAGIWFDFLSPSKGIVNMIISAFGFPKMDFLTDKGSIRWVLMWSEAWRSIGWDSIIYLAAILGISNDLYEAATIDGANRFDIVVKIILPALVVPMTTIFILNIGFFMNAGVDQIFTFTNDSVNSVVDIIDTYVYRMGLMDFQYSFATAANLFKGVIGVVLVLSTNYISKKLTGTGAW